MKANSGRKPGCRNPSVKNCLNCTRIDCDAPSDCTLDISEIQALIIAGMLPLSAITKHIGAMKRAQKRRLTNESKARI